MDLFENPYSAVLRIADYHGFVRFLQFNMAEPTLRIQYINGFYFDQYRYL